MPRKINVVLVSTDYEPYGDASRDNVRLTSKQAAILSSLAVLALYRDVWQDGLSDSDWDALSDTISDAIDRLDNAI